MSAALCSAVVHTTVQLGDYLCQNGLHTYHCCRCCLIPAHRTRAVPNADAGFLAVMWMALGRECERFITVKPCLNNSKAVTLSSGCRWRTFWQRSRGRWPAIGAWRRCIFILEQHIPVQMTLRPSGRMCRWRTSWRRYQGRSPASGAWRRQGRKRPPPTAARRASPPPMAVRPAPLGERPLSDICSHNCPAVLCAQNQQWYLARATFAHQRDPFSLHEKVSRATN